MKTILSYIILLLLSSFMQGCAQTAAITSAPSATKNSNDTFRLEKFIPGSYSMMDVDLLNNLYLVTAGNQLKKLNPSGDSLAVFNDVKKYGNPTLLDVSNPLKVLLYYKNFSTVVILDRLLSPRNSINFRQQQIFSVKAIGTSYDNNIWLFDEQDMKLKKIDESGKLLSETTDWRLIMDDVPAPARIIDANNFVYLYDPEKGFYIFDYYGTFKNNLPLKGWVNVSISTTGLSGFSGNEYLNYPLQSLSLKNYPLPGFLQRHQSIRAMNGKLYVLKEDGVSIYSLP